MDALTELTALPNLHPALVHFPIALLPVAALFELALLLAPGGRGWLERATAALYVAAGLGAGAAFWAGKEAADGLSPLAVDVQTRVNAHSDAAHQLIWLVGVLVVARLALAYVDREVTRVPLRAVSFVAACVAVALLFRTADMGGGLVYRDGVAVEPLAWERMVPEGLGGGRPGLAAGRSRGWDPEQGWFQPDVVDLPEDPGATLLAEGRTLFLLPGDHGDVQVTAELALEDFRGDVGLAHHVRGLEAAGLLILSVPSGETRLTSLDGGSTRVLDEAVVALREDRLLLHVSAIGRHVRGMVGHELAVHGHEPALPEGQCGLYLDGEGAVRIVRLDVTPAGD